MAKATKLTQPRTRRVTVEILPEDVEITVPCSFCSHEIVFYIESEDGFEETGKCDSCKQELRFKGEVESVTRCTVTVSPLTSGPSGGKLETFESKDLLKSSAEEEDEADDPKN